MRHTRLIPLLAAVCAIAALGGCSRRSAKIPAYSMGERVQVGHLIYTVFESQWLVQIGEGLGARVPQNRFFLVRLSVADSGSGELPIPAMTVEDDNGNTYTELTNGEGVPQWMGFLRQVKPAEAVQGNVVFDAPPRHYKLRVQDENEDKSAVIDIPLTFNAEMPEAPVPGSDKKPEK